MSEQLEIARTIKDQLIPKAIVWCWGAHNYTALPRSSKYLGGLRFHVDGAKYQGKVFIMLDGDDLYTVKIGQKVMHGVYFDMLVDLIDSEVETG